MVCKENIVKIPPSWSGRPSGRNYDRSTTLTAIAGGFRVRNGLAGPGVIVRCRAPVPRRRPMDDEPPPPRRWPRNDHPIHLALALSVARTASTAAPAAPAMHPAAQVRDA